MKKEQPSVKLAPKRGYIRLLELLICLYVLVNLTLVGFVPILHHVSLEIDVLDGESGMPVEGVDVSWLHANSATDVRWTTPAGLTDRQGRLSTRMTIQEQPLWAFPLLGSFEFRNRTLRLSKEGYEELTVNLSEALLRSRTEQIRLRSQRG